VCLQIDGVRVSQVPRVTGDKRPSSALCSLPIPPPAHSIYLRMLLCRVKYQGIAFANLSIKGTRKIISAPGFLGLQVTTNSTQTKAHPPARHVSPNAQIKCLHQNQTAELYIILCINAFVCFLICAGMRALGAWTFVRCDSWNAHPRVD